MQSEIEAKFADIDVIAFRQKLTAIGATEKHPEVAMRRKNFDFPDRRMENANAWIRVRDEGNKITLSYKQLGERTIDGMKELNVNISDFETTCNILIATGLVEKSYQETKRETWHYKDVEITIDTWPWIPSFVEIEGPTENDVKQAADDLELDWSKALHGSVEVIYQIHYDFTDAEINNWKSITFVQPPDWLLAKKK